MAELKPLLKFDNISYFGGITALKDVSFDVKKQYYFNNWTKWRR